VNTIQISGITYEVVSIKAFGDKGRKEMKLRRPNGRRFYFAVVYENGSISEAV
jgi:hypothetical protein